jgi:L-fuconate dehydratase
VREEIGPDRHLMIDANQIWDVGQAIAWVKELAPWKPLWIEEPTSPDDILGHAAVPQGAEAARHRRRDRRAVPEPRSCSSS